MPNTDTEPDAKAWTQTPVVICAPETCYVRRVGNCPNCKQHRHLAGVDGGLWYGITWTCCACGDSWCDGQMLERPFARSWRVKAAATAREIWAAAPPAGEHRRWVNALIADYHRDIARELEAGKVAADV